jgi:uncharacterized YceG family protein
VPGGRSAEEREAARRERDGRREQAGPTVAELEASLAAGRGGGRRGRSPRTAGGSPRWGRVVAAAVLSVVLIVVGWLLISLFQPLHGDGDGSVRVAIPVGSSLGQIADQLEQEGVISSSSFFQLRARLAGRSDGLKPGAYALQRNMSFAAALNALERGVPPDVVRITIPEGRSRQEVTTLLGGKLRGSYVRATRRSSLLDPRASGAKGATSLEGFLFPATYELKSGRGVQALIDEQLTTFRRQFRGVDLRYARSKNLTPYDVLIIASMVEREAQLARERPLVASVIYNRLHDGMALGIDATTRFALNQWDRPLRQSELATQSPYNTRTNPGLPPGPIGNPGLASIEAAARPAKSDYLFYVVKPCGNGQHAFSATDAQFQRDVDRYNREREKRGGNSPASC